jgi:transketolase
MPVHLKKGATMYDANDRLAATTLRMLAIDAVDKANSGHPGLPLGAADIAIVLWTRFLRHNPADPTWPNRDRFVLSAGHGSALLYSLLHLNGYPMPLDEIMQFRQWGSHTPGHPEYDPERGVETTTGPLGQGFGNAVGLALAERILADKFNRPGYPIIDHYTYVLASDGDMMEGISHEVASLAGHLKLGRLIVLYDDNHISIDGPTELTFSDDVPARFAAYNWHVQRVDGLDMPAVDRAVRAALAEDQRPSLIACRTHIGFGSPRQDTAKVHGAPLGEADLRKTKEFFGWNPDDKFFVPAEVKSYFERNQDLGGAKQAEWEELLIGYRSAHPDLAEEWDRFTAGKLAPGWEKYLPSFEDKPEATRVSSGKVLDAIAPHLPLLIGGSADLTGSNNTLPKDARKVSPGDYGGSYIFFGVREHGMGAILSGLALHGLRPYGGTFLIFSDYMRPAIRLAALMGLPVIYVFTHDSIGLGEDGPTHQPVEHLAALRAIPNLVVIRPADGNETAKAWEIALNRKNGPTALILTRQNLPQITPQDDSLTKGGYILDGTGPGRISKGDGTDKAPQLVLLATGSELHIALAAADRLAEEGIQSRLVSMPSWELFDAQPGEYRKDVLPRGIPRLSVEAGITWAWDHYLQEGRDEPIGLDHFGASAPYKLIYEQFGLTAEKIADKARKLLR